MRTEYLKVLHEKALVIIDSIKRCSEYEQNAINYLDKYDKANWLDLIQIVNKREDLVYHVSKYASVRQRLTKSYLKTMDKIQSVAIDYLESKRVVHEEY